MAICLLYAPFSVNTLMGRVPRPLNGGWVFQSSFATDSTDFFDGLATDLRLTDRLTAIDLYLLHQLLHVWSIYRLTFVHLPTINS